VTATSSLTICASMSTGSTPWGVDFQFGRDLELLALWVVVVVPMGLDLLTTTRLHIIAGDPPHQHTTPNQSLLTCNDRSGDGDSYTPAWINRSGSTWFPRAARAAPRSYADRTGTAGKPSKYALTGEQRQQHVEMVSRRRCRSETPGHSRGSGFVRDTVITILASPTPYRVGS
jgi:hypothetical protein